MLGVFKKSLRVNKEDHTLETPLGNYIVRFILSGQVEALVVLAEAQRAMSTQEPDTKREVLLAKFSGPKHDHEVILMVEKLPLASDVGFILKGKSLAKKRFWRELNKGKHPFFLPITSEQNKDPA